jgi:alkanesulfonate monooxygenase SsuD/methylene tetrahydromethanopterin reductase-like flavin-dependent oxidoreductase (luciferase family)
MYFSGNSLNSAEFAARERLGLCMSFHRPESVAKIVSHYRAHARPDRLPRVRFGC